jgi:hypothetical protein
MKHDELKKFIRETIKDAIFYAKKRGHKKMNEMWMAWENK